MGLAERCFNVHSVCRVHCRVPAHAGPGNQEGTSAIQGRSPISNFTRGEGDVTRFLLKVLATEVDLPKSEPML